MKRITLDQHIPKNLDINAAANHSSALMLRLLENSPKPVKAMTNHLAKASGKGVRSSLLLASATDKNGNVPKDTILAAAAVELFHLATLIHDDVIDEASTRRGISSLHVEFSNKEAVICGDYLLCMAISAISAIYGPHTSFAEQFAQAVGRVCLGELRQHSNNFNFDISFYEYLRTIHGKTASLFFVSAYGGAILGGSKDDELCQIGKLGSYIGMIFQIIDDVKDYVLNHNEALKPTKADITSGVINLPLLMAFLKEPSLRETVRHTAPFELSRLIKEVYRLNGIQDSLDIVYRYLKKSKKIMKSIKHKRKAEELDKQLTLLLTTADKLTQKSANLRQFST